MSRLGERGFAILTGPWRTLRHRIASPRHLGDAARAALHLTQHEWEWAVRQRRPCDRMDRDHSIERQRRVDVGERFTSEVSSPARHGTEPPGVESDVHQRRVPRWSGPHPRRSSPPAPDGRRVAPPARRHPTPQAERRPQQGGSAVAATGRVGAHRDHVTGRRRRQRRLGAGEDECQGGSRDDHANQCGHTLPFDRSGNSISSIISLSVDARPTSDSPADVDRACRAKATHSARRFPLLRIPAEPGQSARPCGGRSAGLVVTRSGRSGFRSRRIRGNRRDPVSSTRPPGCRAEGHPPGGGCPSGKELVQGDYRKVTSLLLTLQLASFQPSPR